MPTRTPAHGVGTATGGTPDGTRCARARGDCVDATGSERRTQRRACAQRPVNSVQICTVRLCTVLSFVGVRSYCTRQSSTYGTRRARIFLFGFSFLIISGTGLRLDLRGRNSSQARDGTREPRTTKHGDGHAAAGNGAACDGQHSVTVTDEVYVVRCVVRDSERARERRGVLEFIHERRGTAKNRRMRLAGIEPANEPTKLQASTIMASMYISSFGGISRSRRVARAPKASMPRRAARIHSSLGSRGRPALSLSLPLIPRRGATLPTAPPAHRRLLASGFSVYTLQPCTTV